MSIEGAIFDMDGTLIDSMHLWVGVPERYLKTIGVTASPEQLHDMGGMMLDDMAQYVVNTFSTGLTWEQVMKGINKVVEPGYFYEVQPKPTVVETLERLQTRGVSMCVATATDRYLAEAALNRTGLSRFFGRMFTSPEEHMSKYEPEIFLKAGRFLGVPKDRIYVFEDAYRSVCGAKAAGYKVIAVHDKWSDRRRAEIARTADLYVEHFGDLDLDTL